MTMQQYLENDLRRQCMRGIVDSQSNNHNGMKIAGLVGLKKSSSTANVAAGRLGGWSASHSASAAPMNNSSWITGGALTQPRRKSLWFQNSNNGTATATTRPSTSSSILPTPRHHFKSHSMGSDSNHPSSTSAAAAIPRRSGRYDGLTLAQKVEIIVNDDIQWLKLQQSLRDHADGLWTSLAVQQVLHIYVQQRIDELERLESALLEPNGSPSAAASTDTATNNTINNDPVAIAVAEEVGVVYAVKKFARRASQLATQSYLAPQNTTINSNNQNTK